MDNYRIAPLPPLTAYHLYQQAVIAQTENRITEAIQLYQQSLSIHSDFPQAHNNLGTIFYAHNELDEAIFHYDEAIRITPDYAEAYNNRAVAKQLQGKRQDAIQDYLAAIRYHPNYAEAHYNLGTAYQENEQLTQSITCFDQAIAIKPDYAAAYNDRGAALQDCGEHDEAQKSYKKSLELNPYAPETWNNYGTLLHELDQLQESIHCYEKAIELNPHYAEAWSNKGNVLRDIENFDAAFRAYDRAISLRPNYLNALGNRAECLCRLNCFEEALHFYDQALLIEQDNPELLRRRGYVLYNLKRTDEAMNSINEAIRYAPKNSENISSKALVLWCLERFGEALAHYDRAIMLDPHNYVHRFHKSLGELLLGFYETGWENYEARLKVKSFRKIIGLIEYDPARQWKRHQTITGQKLLISAEQGLGDTIQFCRYAPILAQQGIDVSLEVPECLYKLMHSLHSDIRIFSKGKSSPNFDWHISLLSLPYILSTTTKTIPHNTPYLSADPTHIARWSALSMFNDKRPKIGIVWAGNPKHENNHNRSVALRFLEPLFKLPYTFYCLQKEVSQQDGEYCAMHGIHTLNNQLHDFSDTAAAVSLMDLVISIDTSVAHLAGALNKPLWVMLPFMPDWRWMLQREDNLWYPSARLFRQTIPQEWESVIERIKKALTEHFTAI